MGLSQRGAQQFTSALIDRAQVSRQYFDQVNDIQDQRSNQAYSIIQFVFVSFCVTLFSPY
jgi:hypothetical protein